MEVEEDDEFFDAVEEQLSSSTRSLSLSNSRSSSGLRESGGRSVSNNRIADNAKKEEEEEKMNGSKEEPMTEGNAAADEEKITKKEEDVKHDKDVEKENAESNSEKNKQETTDAAVSEKSEEPTDNLEQKQKNVETQKTNTAADGVADAEMTPIKNNIPSLSIIPPPPTPIDTSNDNPLTSCLPTTTDLASPLDSLLQNANCCPDFTAVMFNTSTSDPVDKPPTSSPKRNTTLLSKSSSIDEEQEEKNLPPPLPSRIDEEEEEEDDGASVSTTSTRGIVDESSIFRIVNKDTGETTDIRDFASTSEEKKINIDTSYSLFPTKEQLFQTRPSLLQASAMNAHAVTTGGDVSVDSGGSSVVSRSFSYESGGSSSLPNTASPRPPGGESSLSVVSSATANSKKKKKFGKKLQSFKSSMKKSVTKAKAKSSQNLSPKREQQQQHELPKQKSAPPPLKTIETSSSSNHALPPPSPHSSFKKSPSKRSSKRPHSKSSPSHSSSSNTATNANTTPLEYTLPSNSLQVKCYQKPINTTEYNPMLLLQSNIKAHDGPIWCLAFSPSGEKDKRGGGKYLASGGEDGVICIWAVAPFSNEMHCEDEKFWKDEEVMGGGGGGGYGDDVSSIGRGVEEEEEEEREVLSPVMSGNGPELGTEVQILSSKPIRRYTDHTEHVIDFSWSSTNFLLSASLDKTVRLYHVSRPSCLQIFKHADLVTAVAFHPRDDGYFLSGGSDKKLRVWSILDGRVKDWAQAPEMITAARYTPDARFVVAGLLHGQVYFYDVNGLKYYTQIACRNRHGSMKEGKKVTGLTFMRDNGGSSSTKGTAEGGREGLMKGGGVCTSNASLLPEPDEEHLAASPKATSKSSTSSDLSPPLSRLMNAVGRNISTPKKYMYRDKMLVTTNDSRLRLYGLNDFCMIRKYKGLTNMQMQIRARFNETGDYIVCGSEGGNIYIWNTATKSESLHLKVGGMHNYDRTKSYESFEASRASLPIVTDTVFVPSRGVKESLMSSKLFPSLMNMDSVKHDMSSAAIITCDYEGTIRVFMRKACIDAVYLAAGPGGSDFD